MDYFRIEGAKPLSGDIAPMGNKDSALPLLAASVLTDDPLTIGNVPDIGDVRTKLALLDSLGIDTCFENQRVRTSRRRRARRTAGSDA